MSAPKLPQPWPPEIVWLHERKSYRVAVVGPCSLCGTGPVVMLPPHLLAQQADATNAACIECGHGFEAPKT